MKISKHFDIREFVPRAIWETFGPNSRWFVRPEIIALAEFYREWFKAPVTINTWMFGKDLQQRGYRSPTSATGGFYSQHKLGCAFDCEIKGYTPAQVYKIILQNEPIFMKAGLTTLEDVRLTPTWLHSDIRNTGLDHILIVRP